MAAPANKWSPTARELLTQLQYSCSQNLGNDAKNIYSAAEKRLAEQMGATLGSLLSMTRNDDLPTPYEYPVLYNLMLEYAGNLELAAEKLKRPLKFDPLLGTINSGRLNAMAIAVPGTKEFLILFEGGLFGFLNLISKIVSKIIIKKSTSENVELQFDGPLNIETLDIERFIDALIAYTVYGHPNFAKQYMPKEEIRAFHDMLLISSELFIMGHEYGHVIEGHLDFNSVVSSAIADVSINECLRDWSQELLADLCGIELSIIAAQQRGYSIRVAFAGADMFFGCAQLIDWTHAILTHGEQWENVITDKFDRASKLLQSFVDEESVSHSLGSHPLSIHRRLWLRSNLPNLLPKGVSDSSAIVLADRIEQIRLSLWEKSLPYLLQLHSSGVRPAVIWE